MLTTFYYSCVLLFFFKKKTAYEMRISDWSSDVCSSDLKTHAGSAGRYWPAGRPDQASRVSAPGAARDCVRAARRQCLHPEFHPPACAGPVKHTDPGIRSGFPGASDAMLRHVRSTGFRRPEWPARPPDRKSVVSGKGVSVRVNLGGGRIIKN